MIGLKFIIAILLLVLVAAGVALALLAMAPGLVDEIPTSWGLLAGYCLAVFLLNVVAGWAIGILRPRTGRATKFTYLVLAIVFAIASPLIGAATLAAYYCARGSCV